MRGERLQASSIRTSGSLYRGMVDSGISKAIASHLYDHEKAHADADREGSGEFGFYATGGFIVAYYLIKGERTPEQLMEIAKAPGFAEMSNKDWEIYKRAWKEWLKEAEEERREKIYKEKADYSNLKKRLIDALSEKLDNYSKKGEFPVVQEILEYDFINLLKEHGSLIYQVYNEAIEEIKAPLAKTDSKEN